MWRSFYGCMAGLSNVLSTIVESCKGTLESVRAAPETKFNSKLHIIDDSQLSPYTLNKGDVIITTSFRIRYRGREREWRLCAPAKVILAPSHPNARTQSGKSERETVCH
ncbi:hypothetical protein MFRU_011g02690 [Monilinia fructicola]|nr:hypothetical protein MFRU_011g02690 [Monilinia fructicola]